MTTTIEPDNNTTPDPTDADTVTASSSAAQEFPVAEALYRDPKDLVLDDNVRENFTLSDFPDVVASIRANGVKTAIKAYREPDGRLLVFEGQIRLLIALEVGCPSVPVWVEPAPDLTAKDRKVARIIEQINANDHRVPLTDGDRGAGIADMLDLGVSVTRISKALAIPDLDKIRKAGKVGHSRTARSMLDDNQLDLDQAEILAEFDTVGDTAAVQQLQHAPRTTFLYQAHQIRQEREEDRARFAASLPYATSGFAVAIMEPETLGPDAPYLPAEDLVTSGGEAITPELLHENPAGWVVYLETEPDAVLVETATGTVVDPGRVDWTTKNHPESTAAEGLLHADAFERRHPWAPHYYLPANLLDIGEYQRPPIEPPTSVDIDQSEPFEVENDETATDSDSFAPRKSLAVDADDVAEVEDEAARAEREAHVAELQARAEQRRAELEAAAREAKRLQDRHDALTKNFASATGARVDFVRKFAGRTTAPTSAQRFLLETSGVHLIGPDDYKATQNALDWLNVSGWRAGLAETAAKARPGRCTVMLLTLVFAAHEARISKDGWGHKDLITAHYLHYLAELGHNLMPVEQAAAGDVDPNTLDPDD
ncbi:ParB/RepB/Spo0J family partition protein [Nocardia jiangxiensis]|uniref:ParB/RepB/Spo0J family partition protein n=1 Tax=Nocardia jiangxiensis TaxID=282685 RepID=A0ABW6S225_9NOCA